MSLFRWIAVIALVAGPSALGAQQVPPPDQARRLLETRPDLVAQLRREIASSGLTPDQIRARLRAAGYPDELLDAYLSTRPQRGGGRDTLVTTLPSEDVLDAVAALGIVDSVDTSELRNVLRQRMAATAGRSNEPGLRDSLGSDSLRADSLGDPLVVDSLGRLVPRARRAPSARTVR